MSNDSTSAGYLTPTGTEPDYDKQLENQLVLWISGVTGIDKSLVYPRWTDPQTQIPKNGITWCAFGVTSMPRTGLPADIQGDDHSEQWTWENVTVICCFYGPGGAALAASFREGIYVPQNNAELNRAGLSLVGTGTLLCLPELINNQWVRRYDLTVTLSRKNVRSFNIRTLQSAPVHFFGE